MLTIILNGQEEKLNIGCRTFISLGELLKLLAVSNPSVTLNGENISSSGYNETMVKGGDSVALQTLIDTKRIIQEKAI